MSNDIDKIFKDLEEAGKNDVNNLINWMKNSRIMESMNEVNVRKLFGNIQNQQKVDLKKFKEVIEQMALEQKKSLEQLSKQLVDEAPKIIDAAVVGLNAFKETLKAGK